MDKSKNILIELTEEDLKRRIERLAQEIQKAKEKRLRVYMATTIYKSTVVTYMCV